MSNCLDHIDYINEVCADCKLPIDTYGNTEYQFDYCSFPDCGCDGARLCMAKNGASERSSEYNVEGMYASKDPAARMKFIGNIYEEKRSEQNT